MITESLREVGLEILRYGGYSLSISTIGCLLYRMMKPVKKEPENIVKVNDFFRNVKFYGKDKNNEPNMPYLIEHENYDNGELFIYTIPNGKAIRDINNDKTKEALSHSLKGEIEIWNLHNRAFIRSYTDKVESKIYYDKKFILNQLSNIKLALPIGYSHQGFIYHDLEKYPGHILLGGTTRYGKSNLLDMIITSAALAYTPTILQLNLLDYKNGVEFQDFQDLPHVLNFSDDPQEADIIFNQLSKELESRMKIVRKYSKKNINGLNIPYIITIIDEIAMLHGNNDVLDALAQLTQQGAAAGLFFIIATQRPEVKYVPGSIKTNCDTRISLRMKSDIDSRTILDNGKAASLPPVPGRAIYQHGDDLELQIPFMQNEKEDDTLIQSLIADRIEELAHKKTPVEDKEFKGMII